MKTKDTLQALLDANPNPLPVCDYNHLLLYAKHHYMRGDSLMMDLDKILSERCALTSCTPEDIWSMLCMALYMYCKPEAIHRDVLDKLFFCWNQKGDCTFDFAAQKILTCLSNVQVCEIDDASVKYLLNLGKADSKILPLSDWH